MVIYHFNRLIRNKFIWGAFAVMIAFAFVSVDSCSSSAGGSTDAGTLDGHKVPARTYRTLEHYIRQTGRSEGVPPSGILYTQTWERLAAAQTAEKIGLTATPALIQQEILSSGAFAQGFDPNAYRYLLQQNLQMTEHEFEFGLANSITLRMVGTVVGAAAWASPMEVDDALAIYTDSFTVQHAVVSNTFADADIDVPDADIMAHYEARRATYALPDRVSIRAIAIPISNYVAAANVTDADIIDYYDSNSQLFTRPAGTNDAAASETIPLAEARESIVEKLKLEQAADEAFADACHGLLDNAVANGFESVADTLDLPITTTKLFSADGFLPGFENNADVREKAFELDAGRNETRFNAVRGDTVVYLIAAFSNDVARIPALEEVRDTVQAATLTQARLDMYKAHVSTAYEDIATAVADGTSFATAAADNGLTATTNYTFSINTGIPSSLPGINAAIREAVKLHTGGIAVSDATLFGNAVIVTVVERKPGDTLSAAFLQDQLRDTVEKRLFPALFAEWSGWNLKQVHFKPTPGTEPIAITDEYDD